MTVKSKVKQYLRNQNTSLKALLFIIFLLLFSQQWCKAQQNKTDSFNITQASFLLPQPMPKGVYKHAIAIHYIVPPTIWTLDMIKAPMFNYSAKYSLPKDFSLQGELSTLFISNRLSAGPFWSYKKNDWYAGLGYQIAFNYGVLKQFGYNTTLTGWEQQPSITVGYSFGKTALILRGDMYYTNDITFNESGHKIKNNEGFINGYSITTSFEQRIYKNHVMSLGLKINYLRYHVIAWPALPVNNYRYFFPEFHLGFNLN
jgi:hypothetical protein